MVSLCFWCSCSTSINSKNAIFYKLQIVLVDKLSALKNDKFPDDIVNLCKPIRYGDSDKFFMPKPVVVYRIGKEIKRQLNILRNNETNFNSYTNSVADFFLNGDGKSIGKDLSTNNPENANQTIYLTNYLANIGKRDKIFYYSQDAKNDSVNNHKLYNNIDSLKSEIADSLSENAGFNIVIIFNPKEVLTKAPDTTLDTVASPPLEKPSLRKKKTVSEGHSKMDSHKTIKDTNLNSLEEYFVQLSNPNISYESKSALREKILRYFTSLDAEVIFVNSSQETSTGTTIGKYVKAISMTNRQVTIVDKKIQDGKIFEIYVSEK